MLRPGSIWGGPFWATRQSAILGQSGKKGVIFEDPLIFRKSELGRGLTPTFHHIKLSNFWTHGKK